MKKVLYLILSMVFLSMNTMAEVVNDSKKVSIRAVMPDYENMTKEASDFLKDKLTKIITSTGLADNGLTDRFVFTAKVNVLQKDILPTTPVRVSQKLEITFFVGDVIENKIFSSATINVAGIGTNENKAYIDAIKHISVTNMDVKSCLEEGKLKIAEYYQSHCNSIIQEADRLLKSGEYEAAIAMLVAVPEACEECYRLTREKAVEVNDFRMDIEGQKLIKEANAVWMVKQDYECGAKALEILSKVDPLAKCSQQADEFMTKISNKLRANEAAAAEIEKRNWEFKMQQYQDRMEMSRTKEANNTMLLSKLIGAAENVGCAFGNNQPKVVNNTNLIRRW